jgi:hypothetical protein
MWAFIAEFFADMSWLFTVLQGMCCVIPYLIFVYLVALTLCTPIGIYLLAKETTNSKDMGILTLVIWVVLIVLISVASSSLTKGMVVYWITGQIALILWGRNQKSLSGEED